MPLNVGYILFNSAVSLLFSLSFKTTLLNLILIHREKKWTMYNDHFDEIQNQFHLDRGL